MRFQYKIFILSFQLSLSSFSFSAQEIHFDDLQKTGQPLVATSIISGLSSEGASYVNKFSEIDTGRIKSKIEISGGVNCNSVAKDYGLYTYCTTKRCDGFSSNYSLYRLCSSDDIDAMSGNYGVWRYLKDGDPAGFAKDYKYWSKAKKEAGSYEDRKRFVIYYMRGYTYGH